MIKFSNLKLRYQLLLLIIVAVVMMLVGQVIYYLNFRSLTRKRADVYFRNMTEQIEKKIDMLLRDVESIAYTTSYSKSVQKYIHEEEALNKFKNMDYVIDNLNYIISSNYNIQNIRIIQPGGEIIKSVSNEKQEVFTEIAKEYAFEGNNFKKPFYTHCFLDEKSNSYYYAYVNPIFSALEGEFSTCNIGICVIMCKTDALRQTVEGISLSDGSLFMITDSSGHIIASNAKGQISDKSVNEFKKLVGSNAFEEIEYNGRTCMTQIGLIEETGWNIITVVPLDELMKDMNPMLRTGFIILVITIILLFFIGFIFIRNITGPVSKMINSMKKVGENDIKYRLNVPGKNEVGQIANHINRMLERIESMTRRIVNNQETLYELEIAKKQAELSFYQNQINPHFLYNTLECIRSIGLANKIPEIVSVSTAMAKMFRYNVKESDVVTVYDEIECVKDYFHIMSMRYMGKFHLEVSIEDTIMKAHIIKMILQPIVENSIYHGLEKVKGIGSVYITGFYNNKGDIILEIKDNGKGMAEQELKELNNLLNNNSNNIVSSHGEKRSVGLVNSNRRLKLNYGCNYGIEIESKLNVGTTVQVRIPST